MNLYAIKYNNYYNRIVKKFDTLEEYLIQPYYNGLHIDNVSFNPGDGVNTSQIIDFVPEADYIIITGTNNAILSRWFIIQADRERTGQYNILLKRDVMVDSYDEIMNSDSIIEKAYIPATNNLIFNNEGINVNQIKKSETFLKDRTNIQWIVGYYAKSLGEKNFNIKYNIGNAIPINQPIANWKWNKFNTTSGYVAYPHTLRFGWNYKNVSSIINTCTTLNKDGTLFSTLDTVHPGVRLTYPFSLDILRANFNDYGGTPSFVSATKAYTIAKSTVGIDDVEANEDELKSYNGKTIIDSNGRYFKVSVVSGNDYEIVEEYVPNSDTTGLAGIMRGCLTNLTTNIPTDYTFQLTCRAHRYYINISEITNIAATVSFSTTKNECQDALYDIFAIPYGTMTVGNITTSEELAKAAAMAIGTELGTSNLYDLQVLPYCPVPELITGNGEISLTNVNSKYYNAIMQNGNTLGYVFHVLNSQFTFDINVPLNISKYLDDNTAYGQAINTKISNECDLYRLCSPNYNGIFEFSVAKNGGVSSFNVDCTYKPYQPYIHINPQFDGLYGKNYNDNRGLILNGDFSFGQISDAWVEYQVQNKNFQEMFDREIKHMDTISGIGIANTFAGGFGVSSISTLGRGPIIENVPNTPTNQWERYKVNNIEYWGLTAPTHKKLTPSGWGLIGAGLGTLTSVTAQTIGWIENRNYAKDKFNLQIGNIKALPYSLSKVTAITANYKKWPFIEYYTCTDEEKEAFYKKLKYDGMTVGVIDTPIHYVYDGRKVFIKAEVIKAELEGNDYVYTSAVIDELKRGFYIGEDTEEPIPSLYNITVNAEHITASASNPTTIGSSNSVTLKFTADAGYIFPESVLVTNAQYTWSRSTGELTLINATGNVSVTITGTQGSQYPIYLVLTHVNNTQGNPGIIIAGQTATLTFTAPAHYTLPSSITVTGASYIWTQNTGTVVISNPTAAVYITITGVPINRTLYTHCYDDDRVLIPGKDRSYTLLEGSTVHINDYVLDLEDEFYYYDHSNPASDFTINADAQLDLFYNYVPSYSVTWTTDSEFDGSQTPTIVVGHDYTGAHCKIRYAYIGAITVDEGTATINNLQINNNEATFDLNGVYSDITLYVEKVEPIIYEIFYTGSHIASATPDEIEKNASITCTVVADTGYKITNVQTSEGSITNVLGLGTRTVTFTLSGCNDTPEITVTTSS